MARPDPASARTLLFVPANRPDRFPKAAAARADLVIVDLEDAVPEADKSRARDEAVRWLAEGGRAAVRVNGAATTHHADDVDMLAGLAGLSAVVLPRADDAAAVRSLHQRLGPDVGIIPLIESALGVVRATDLATTSGVTRLAFGHLDFAADIDAADDDQAMLMARSTLVVASRAARLPGPVDGVTTSLNHPAAAAADAHRARRLGFAGKLCVHPAQVDAVNRAFSPSNDEIGWARRIIEAAQGRGAVGIDGHLVDGPMILKANAILRRANGVA